MANKKKNIVINTEKAKAKKDLFLKKMESEMIYRSDLSSDSMSFEWLEQFEFACPFIDNVVRVPKLSLVKEEIIVPAEKTKKITVESVKDLVKHPNYVSKMNEENNELELKKIMNVISEETYNIYENRFLYTLITEMDKFIYDREEELKNFEYNENKSLEYSADTVTNNEKVNIVLRITSESFPNDKVDKNLIETIKLVKKKIKRIKEYISSWQHSPMYKEIDNANITLLKPPIKKTNILLKNQNFIIALKLYDFLQKFNKADQEDSKDNLEKEMDPLQGFLDHSFLIDFCVLDSISRTKMERKQKMSEYAVLMLKEEIHRTVALLLSIGVEVTNEELLKMIAEELKKENNRFVGADDVKKKFKSAMDEYLERMQGSL